MNDRINRRDLIKLMGGAAATLPMNRLASSLNLMQGDARPRNAPNFIFIITDDQQQAAMSAYGNKILKTPNMDRIASEGIRFTEAFVTNSLCAPSRASMAMRSVAALPFEKEDAAVLIA